MIPTTGGMTPTTGGMTPTTGAVTPTTGGATPTTGAVIPTTGAVTPTTGGATPTTGAVTPTTGAVTPTTGAVTPTTGAVTPTTGAVTPTTGGTTPTTGAVTPTTGAVTPTTGGRTPTTGGTTPTTGAVTPTTGAGVTTPDGRPSAPDTNDYNAIRLPPRSRRFPIVVLLLLLAQRAVLSRATTPTTTPTTTWTPATFWSPGNPLFPTFNLTPKTSVVPRCGVGVSSGCLLDSPGPMDWEAAQHFCRSHRGFLADRGDLAALRDAWPPRGVTWLRGNLTRMLGVMAWPVRNVTQKDLTWTAFTNHRGRYQWLSQFPVCSAGVGELLAWEGREPPMWSRDCAALHILRQRFLPHPCKAALAFYCHLPPSTSPSGVDAREVELRVTLNNNKNNNNKEALQDNWVIVREGEFPNLSLTCTAHNSRTGDPLTHQPSVFWSKDGVFIHSQTATMFPAVIHDSTKSGTEEQSPFLLKQGTYWCETWVGRSSSRLVSNKVLVTMENWLVLVVAAHRYEALVSTTSDAVRDIRQAFVAHFPDFDNYTVDPISIEREMWPGTTETLAKYRFQVHVPTVSDSFGEVLELVQDEGRVYEEIYESNGYLRTSSVALSTHCPRHTQRDKYGNQIVWPFTAAGRVQPLHYRCEAADGRLQTGDCRWNHTHGATVSFDPSQCKRFDHCPQDYTSVSNYVCVSATTPAAWQKGFPAMYKNGYEKGLLDYLWLHSVEWEAEPLVYENTKQMLKDTKDYHRVWLPVRRVVPWGPLTFLGPGSSDYPYSQCQDSPSFLNITWAAGHPLPDRDCLALDMDNNSLLTLDCDTSLPFAALLDVAGLKDIPDQKWTSSVPGLIVESPSCPQDWYSTTYQEQDVCFKIFLGVLNSTWGEAREFCQTMEAQLASPALGLLDWVYRQYLYDSGVDAVWMSVGHPGSAGAWAQGSAQGDPQAGFINWKADTNHSLPSAALTPHGWSREGQNSSKTNILCQKPPLDEATTSIHVHKSENAATQTVCVDVTHEELLMNGNESLRCFVNGRLTDLKQGSNSECTYEIDGGIQGHFQCQAWVTTPFHLARSNVLLNRKPRTLTCAVNLHQETDYTPMLHDSTFSPAGLQEGNQTCVSSFTTKLESELKRLGFPDVTLRVDNFFYSRAMPEAKLSHHFQVELEFTDDRFKTMTDERMYQTLVEIFPPGEPFHECSLASLASTVACPGQVTRASGGRERNLTWPRTEGKAVVLPQELCITVGGEPVTRECLGGFLLGYRWETVSGNCTGEPSNVTRRLWEINRSALESPPTVVATLSNLTADGKSLKAADIHFVATKFQSLSREETLPDLDLESIVETLNNVMEADDEAFKFVQNRLNSSSLLSRAFEDIAFKVKVPETEGDHSLTATRKFVSVERVDLDINSTIIGFQSTSGVMEEKTLKAGKKFNILDSDVAIIFPENLTRIVAAGSDRLARMQGGGRHKIQLTFAVYRNPKLFQDNESYPNYTVNSHVLQATYHNKVVTNLKEPVRLVFRPSRQGNDSKCVYWDFQKNSGRGGWSTEGCWQGEAVGDCQVCFCNHLTSFAQLMNYNDEQVGGVHSLVLNIITIVGCSLSIVSLLLVFTTFFLFKKWRRHIRNKILVNLSFSIFCSIVIFLAGINQTWNDILCRSVAVALHYFILASFGWMLVEAVHQYLKFVKVVGTYIPRFMWKASVSAWGAPLIPIIVVLVYDSSLYDNTNEDNPEARICWMSSQGFQYAFLPPLVLTMTVNLVMFSLIIYGATCGRVRVTSTMSDRELYMSQLRMAICIFFLLGFTWIFGLLAIWKVRLTFSYLFCVFNTLQGFFIFLFHVFRERSARRLWREFLSIISKTATSSEHSSSQNTNNLGQGKANMDSVTYNQEGAVSINPKKTYENGTRSSVRSARTISTLLHSRTSVNP